MTIKAIDGIVTGMAQRPRLSINIDPELLYAIRVVAVRERKTMTQLVLTTLADKYPELKDKVDKESEA